MKKKDDENRRESGVPGGGAGRKDDVGRSGVYPMSGPHPPGEAEIRGQASWGQGERGAAGYEDHGSSELSYQGGQVLGAYGPGAGEVHVQIPAGGVLLDGDLQLPSGARAVIVFAHGSGSSRHSPRNQYVARVLQEAGFATLLFDLLTGEEESVDVMTGKLRFDIGLLAHRLAHATDWLLQQPGMQKMRVGYFGASTGAAAALLAAAEARHNIGAIVCRGGRPDLAGPALAGVQAPTLLIVGGNDAPVIEMNRQAMQQLRCENRLDIVPGATHLFEEPGALEKVAQLAREWFQTHLGNRQESRVA